jgi:hypothetical protein
MLVSVKMKTKNKMMITLLLITAITTGLFPVYAAPNTLSSNNMKAKKTRPVASELSAKPIRAQPNLVNVDDLSTLDAESIDKQITDAVEAEPTDEDTGAPLWYLYSYGYSTIDGPTVDAAETRFRVKLQLVATKVKNTELGALYKVHWGRVTHDGDQHTVSGYALLDSDGVFYMKLDGEIGFGAIGRIYPAQFGVRVGMKGFIVDDDITYSHVMRGRAIPLTPSLFPRLRNHLQ